MAIRPLKEVLSDALRKPTDDAYRQDVYYLAQKIFGLTLNDICLKREISVEDSLFLKALDRYEKGEPLYYILGSAPFLGRMFSVDRRVLIPRNETEELVAEAGEAIRKSKIKNPDIVDVGTGSGCIAVTLSLEFPDAHIDATDLSSEALTLAKENNDRLGGKVDFYRSDVLEEVIRRKKKYDVLISNPPYIAPGSFVAESVRDYEPGIALFAEDKGLAVYRKIFAQMPEAMKDNAMAFFEISPEQQEDLTDIVRNALPDYTYSFKRDINGYTRFLIVKRKG